MQKGDKIVVLLPDTLDEYLLRMRSGGREYPYKWGLEFYREEVSPGSLMGSPDRGWIRFLSSEVKFEDEEGKRAENGLNPLRPGQLLILEFLYYDRDKEAVFKVCS